MRTLGAAQDPSQVTVRRAALFALLFAVAFLIFWAPLREFLLAIHVLIRDRAEDGYAAPFASTLAELRKWYRWWAPVLWLAWAQLKWWCLFGILALALGPPRPRLRGRLEFAFCALALFSPWFFILDLMCFMTVWAAAGSCVPEPNSMWPFFGDDFRWFVRFWTIRLIVPLALIVTLFLRGAFRWQQWSSVLAGFLMILPVGIVWTLWDRFFVFHIFSRLW